MLQFPCPNFLNRLDQDQQNLVFLNYICNWRICSQDSTYNAECNNWYAGNNLNIQWKKRDFPLETRRFLNKHGIHIDKIFSREGRTFEI